MVDEYAREFEANWKFQRFLEVISEWAADAETERVMRVAANRGFTLASKFCESPIEGMAVAGILTGYAFDVGGYPRVVDGKTGNILIEHEPSPRSTNYFGPTTLTLQKSIGPYRADIVYVRTTRSAPVVLECDGAKFHSSDEQVARDDARTKFLVSKGYKVERVTGVMVNRTPLFAWKLVDPRCVTFLIDLEVRYKRAAEREQ